MVTDRRIAAMYSGAVLLTLAGSAAFLAAAGTADANIALVLRLTARIAFLVLLAVFVARPLRQLLRTPFTAALLRYRPLVGVAFAGIHTGHLLLIVYRAREVADFQFRVADNLPGAVTYLIIFTMVVTTFSAPRRAIGPRAWRALHQAGLYWVTFVFVQTQLPRSVHELADVNWWLLAIVAAAVVVRMTAFFATRLSRQDG